MKSVRHQIIVLLVSALLFSCSGQRLTQANVDQVSEGMSKKQVESILGPPTSVESKDFMLLKRTTYLYRQPNGTVTVLFKDDKVAAKSSTLLKYGTDCYDIDRDQNSGGIEAASGCRHCSIPARAKMKHGLATTESFAVTFQLDQFS